jgi:hypothetical protein
MAIKWSWAWGSELTALLETSAGWDFSNTATSQTNPHTGAPEFTYAGSPTRYTMNLKSSSTARSPLAIGAPQGWLCSHFYLNSASGFSNYQILNIYATSNSRGVYILAQGPDTLKLYVDNAFKEQTVATFAPQTWHHIAVKYDMTTTTWSGQLWMNGVAVTADQTDSGVAQTSTYFRIGGLRNDSLINGAYWAGLVHYDDMADPGSTSRYVTRISPDQDVTQLGPWTPAVNQNVELASPLNTATTVDNAAPSVNDQVTTGLAGGTLATQLGISPTIYGITTHAFAVGTISSVEAGIGSSTGATYTYGDSVVTGAATYCTVTSATNPNTVAAWVASEQPWLRIEIA